MARGEIEVVVRVEGLLPVQIALYTVKDLCRDLRLTDPERLARASRLMAESGVY